MKIFRGALRKVDRLVEAYVNVEGKFDGRLVDGGIFAEKLVHI
jgi:hypothetical protein